MARTPNRCENHKSARAAYRFELPAPDLFCELVRQRAELFREPVAEMAESVAPLHDLLVPPALLSISDPVVLRPLATIDEEALQEP